MASINPGQIETRVTWNEPFAIDLSASIKVSSTYRPNDTFGLGSTPVAYTFEDDRGNRKFCNFTVAVIETGELYLQYNCNLV